MAVSLVSVGKVKMSVQEKLPVTIDMTNILLAVAGATVVTPTATLLKADDGTVITLATGPTVSGNNITQDIDGSLLLAGSQYNLFLGCSTGVTGFEPVQSVLIIAGI
jgi:hypothetical protein